MAAAGLMVRSSVTPPVGLSSKYVAMPLILLIEKASVVEAAACDVVAKWTCASEYERWRRRLLLGMCDEFKDCMVPVESVMIDVIDS